MHKWRISCSGNQNLFIFLLGLLRINYRWKIFWGLIVYMYIMKLFEIIISTNIMIKFKQTHLLSFNYFPRKWSACSCITSVYMKKYINLIFSPLLLNCSIFFFLNTQCSTSNNVFCFFLGNHRLFWKRSYPPKSVCFDLT